MNWSIIAVIFAILLTCIIAYKKINKYTLVRAGTKHYISDKPTSIKMKLNLPKDYKKSRTIMVLPVELGPSVMDPDYSKTKPFYWYPFDYLIVNTDFPKFRKGHFYLLAQNDKYKIALCTAVAWGFPPLFEGSDNLVESECVGEVVGVIDKAKNTIDYHIMTIPCPVV